MSTGQRSLLDRLVGRLGRALPAAIKELAPFRELRRRRRVRSRHPAAAQLLAGRHASRSTEKSILYYTVHRCASSFVTGLIGDLAAGSGLTLVDFDSYLFQLNGRSVDEEILAHPRRRERTLRPAGYIFGPLRRFDYAPGKLSEFRLLLVVRDPRDVLTSLYFAMAFSHSLPAGASRKVFLTQRERALSQGPDEFVRQRSDRLLETYRNYCALLAGGHPSLTLLRYEDMVSSFDSWLGQLVAGCGLPARPARMRELVEKADFATDGEDRDRRKRQVEPGDHLRKLQAQTIAELDQTFAGVLDRLGYRRHS